MKNKLTYVSIAFILISLFSFAYNKNKIISIEIGTKAPLSEIKMKAISGENFSLKDLNKKNGLLVIFSCNTCPFVVGSENNEGWENRYNELYETCEKHNIGMVLVNSNEAKRNGVDSFENMKNHAYEKKYKSEYVIDKRNKLADAFGASTTPHVFLFNNSLELVYKGAIDDNVSSRKKVTKKWTFNALTSLGNGEIITTNTTRNSGCSIKRI